MTEDWAGRKEAFIEDRLWGWRIEGESGVLRVGHKRTRGSVGGLRTWLVE